MLILAFIGVRIWNNYSQLPPGDLIYKNVKKITIPNPNNFTFAVFADNKHNHKLFKKILRKVDADPEISFAVDIGDIVYDGRRRKYAWFVKTVQENFNKPLLTLIGNHETIDHGREVYTQLFGPYYYTFKIGNTVFIMLDNANEKNFDAWQYEWLTKQLLSARNANNQILVFFHVPLFDPRGGKKHHCLSDRKNALKLQELFKKYNINHIFCSHIHGYFAGTWDGVPYTITGGAGAELAGEPDNEHYFYHYLKVNINNKKINIKICKIPTPKTGKIGWFISTSIVYLTGFTHTHLEEMFLLTMMLFVIIAVIIKEKN